MDLSQLVENVVDFSGVGEAILTKISPLLGDARSSSRGFGLPKLEIGDEIGVPVPSTKDLVGLFPSHGVATEVADVHAVLVVEAIFLRGVPHDPGTTNVPSAEASFMVTMALDVGVLPLLIQKVVEILDAGQLGWRHLGFAQFSAVESFGGWVRVAGSRHRTICSS